MSDPAFSVILPIYNQADHLESVVESYERALAAAAIDHELLLVVNGSRDTSLELAHALAERFPAVRVFHEDRGGWGRAVKRGIREARGAQLCYTNSARTTDRDLTLLLLYARAFPDTVVKANRKIRDSWHRRIGSLLYNVECRTLFDLSCWDVNGTPKIFPRQFDALLTLERDDDLIDVEFDALCRRHNYPMIEVPIFSSRRHGARSTTTLRSAARLYIGAFRLA
ncbi:MAG: glycosyltransferase, partial [Candidatus Eremiobacteraeota bacterium]|nr:glycosyltransferase [Candidatus Eremiobacteraeota bacterium]